MRYFILLFFFIISGLKTNALTQKEALEQVKGMDERECVERSLRTILYLSSAGDEQESGKYAERDNFLPVELYLDYDIQTLYDKFGNSIGSDSGEYYSELYEKIYTHNLKRKIEIAVKNYNEKAAKEYKTKKEFCNKLLGYDINLYSCNISGLYIYQKTKTETILLKDDTAIIRLEYTKNPKYFGHFIMKKQNGVWKLDRWYCGDSDKCDFYN